MPELPDVEMFRRHAAATSLHKTIERIHVSAARLLEDLNPESFGKQLRGSRFTRTYRHGKYLLLDAEDRCLVLHFGMTGGLQFVKTALLPRYTCAEFHFTDDGCLAYLSRRLLGHIFTVKDREELIARKQLGPDALDIAASRFCERFADKRGSLKAALMNQSLIAGIGNLYSDEILFQLRLHPMTDVQSLVGMDLKRLYEVTQRVLKTAIKHRAIPDQLPSRYLLPHRDNDGHCPRCRTELKSIKVSGRSAVHCPRCQVR